MINSESINEILEYWFGQLDPMGMAVAPQQQLWFKSSSTTDDYIRDHFLNLIEAALKDELTVWRDTLPGSVALVLLLDQFTRNVFRATPKSFSGDLLALKICRRLVSSGQHLKLPLSHRVFIYIPYEHSESLSVQDEGVALFDQLLTQCPQAAHQAVAGFRQYAVAHRDVIFKFGRFPHRNAILQRQSTAEELEHLQQHGGF
ncbi:DUF924 family protein [Candidatus Litorirhabdus singularis]|nr:DUF924 domain-containing protein [Candidatus Litorirhabdus singularis]